ncbi:MAG: hypothetical protein JNL12_22970 [Planctomycetes bacterium]|nr:hypothetical protein [Planctomycetota bacterium]
MFPTKLSSFLCAAATTLTLGSAVVAQGTWSTTVVSSGVLSSGYLTPTPPVLPPVEYRSNSYSKSIGNTWLGGSVYAYAGMVRQKNGGYELGQASAEFRGTASVLKQSKEVVEIVGYAMNVMNNGVQTRSGQFRVEMLGYSILNSSFSNSSTFAASNHTYNLFPSDVSVSVPVGPVSVTIGGNAGCGFGRSANWLLPAATAKVGINAQANAYAFVNASVSFGIPGFNVGVGLEGKVLEQSLNVNLSASGLWGLSGGATYSLKAITLSLYAWATAIWTWDTTLCSWSAGQILLTLI